MLRDIGVGEGVVEVCEASIWNEEKHIFSLELREQLRVLLLVARLLTSRLVRDRRSIAVKDILRRRDEKGNGQTQTHDGNRDIVHVVANVARLVVLCAEAEVDRGRDDAAELLEGHPRRDAPASPLLSRVANDDEAFGRPEETAAGAAEDCRKDEEPLRSVAGVLVQSCGEDGVANGANGQAPLCANLVHKRAAQQADDAHERKIDGRGGISHVWLLLAGTTETLQRIEGADST